MASSFKEAMDKLAVVGHNPSTLTDCSALIPAAPAFNKNIEFPATKSAKDLDTLTCNTEKFPTLASARKLPFL
jgi:cytochrome c peroxidase